MFEFFAQNFHDMSPSFYKNQRRNERRDTAPESVLSSFWALIVACLGDSHVNGRHLPPPEPTPWLMASVGLRYIRSAAMEVSSFL